MAKLATTHSLADYPRLNIASYRDQLHIEQPDRLPVSYKHRGKQYRYVIQLTTTAPHFGGSRYWFNCPSCSKRVAVLFCAGLYVCRHCIGASYRSQMQTDIDRTHSKLDAIRQRLKWERGIIHGHGSKPHLMHHRTYNRILCEYDHLIQKLVGEYRNALA